jgi:hypothetical protein
VWLQEEGYRQLELPTSLCVPTFSKNLGTRENPGLLCDNIIAVKGENMSDGTYWIDPNAGCIHDAIQVFCNSSSEESCIEPTNHTVSGSRSDLTCTAYQYLSTLAACTITTMCGLLVYSTPKHILWTTA